MIILLTGASHTGKTALAQQLLEKYHYRQINARAPKIPVPMRS